MDWILAIPALPAAAFLLTAFLPRSWRNYTIFFQFAAILASTVLSVVALTKIYPGGAIGEGIWSGSITLATLNGVPFTLSASFDSLAAIMLVMVSIVGSCVQMFSLHYMAKEDRKAWYFSILSLFTAAMLMLVLASNLFLIFVMWEIMGICSYLLIGFWYQNEGARNASKKAFLYTRAGDIGFFVALSAIFASVGSFELSTIIAAAPSWTPWLLGVVSFGLIIAAMGKSAQWPFMMWLPDAMAGPTPASALIHAATMVAAGVFMLARMMPVISLSPAALNTMLVVGIITAIIGAFLATLQTDLKKVLAYSTVSQLGLMVTALGAMAEIAALFHLTTHAFFKSLLFLTAGIIIHATSTQDMRKMGGLSRKMPITTIIFTIGSFSLAGFVPLSGFFSKDEIFAGILHAGHPVIFGLALVMALLTALYVTKTWFTVFFGKPRTKGVKEGGIVELIPVGVLALITLVLGFASPRFQEFLGHEGVWPEMVLAMVSTGVVLVGGALGYLFYAGIIRIEFKSKLWQPLKNILDQNLLFDHAVDVVIVKPYQKLTELLWTFDAVVVDGIVNGTAKLYQYGSKLSWSFDSRVVDGVVNGLATVSSFSGRAFRRLQTGRLQSYQRYIVGAVVVLLFVVVILKGA